MSKAAQKKKPGRVARLDPQIATYIEKKKRPKESVSATLRRLLAIPPRRGSAEFRLVYALPSAVHETLEEARGAAIIDKVKRKLKQPERPLALKEIP